MGFLMIMKLVVFYLFTELTMISMFESEFSFLSNLYLTKIKYGKKVYKSAEHLYQAVSCRDAADRHKIWSAATPKSAKILGRFVKKRAHWDVLKIVAMKRVIELKFRNETLRKKLIETGDKELIHQNYWHDTFWGICACSKHQSSGYNMFGKMLMCVRDELKDLE